MDEKIDWTAIHIAEYEARRKEILFRLGCLEKIFEQTIVTAGIIVTILGLYVKEVINLEFILSMLLISTLIFFFLQVAYLKHHYWLLISASYEERKIIIHQDNKEIYPFKGFSLYVDNLYVHGRIQGLYMKFIGYSEAVFPTAMGLSNLVLFWFLVIYNLNSIDFSISIFFLFYFGYVEIILFIILVIIGVNQRNWTVRGKNFVLK
ncbi:MAG: hypothetical protein GYA18_07590 [Chloroflexi bacterium]|nr:hypothetical protein [Chloroflexota bacterium]